MPCQLILKIYEYQGTDNSCKLTFMIICTSRVFDYYIRKHAVLYTFACSDFWSVSWFKLTVQCNIFPLGIYPRKDVANAWNLYLPERFYRSGIRVTIITHCRFSYVPHHTSTKRLIVPG